MVQVGRAKDEVVRGSHDGCVRVVLGSVEQDVPRSQRLHGQRVAVELGVDALFVPVLPLVRAIVGVVGTDGRVVRHLLSNVAQATLAVSTSVADQLERLTQQGVQRLLHANVARVAGNEKGGNVRDAQHGVSRSGSLVEQVGVGKRFGKPLHERGRLAKANGNGNGGELAEGRGKEGEEGGGVAGGVSVRVVCVHLQVQRFGKPFG
mmetsp:Transcript_1290/g.4042  ORF Transcript_1290/g.4042 Transcript_1290/m.4042 type:complete len:206 (-) Transcript_1290:470-1087(-)